MKDYDVADETIREKYWLCECRVELALETSNAWLQEVSEMLSSPLPAIEVGLGVKVGT